MKTTLTIAAAAAALALSLPAQAASVFSTDYHGVEQATDSSIVATFTASAGAASTVFYVDGFGSLDGDDDWIDVFTLQLNGQEILSGTWNLHGGGTDHWIDNPYGAIYTSYGDFVGISVPLTLAAGTNTLTFTYTSPTTFDGTTRGGFQGINDEGWGLGTVDVTQSISAVPEAPAAALLLVGLGCIASLRRAQRKIVER